jgi:LPXTG-motif cell wall-anchored protein
VTGVGTYVVQPNGSVTFTPAAGYTGSAPALPYRVADSNGTVTSSTVSVVVGAAPVAAPDATTTLQNQPVTLATVGNDQPGTGATLVPSSVQLIDPTSGLLQPVVMVPNQGTYVVDSVTGAITFTPVPWFSGVTTPVSYQVADSDANTATSTVTVHVTAVVPAVVADSATTPFRTPVTIPVLANDTAGDATAPLDITSVVVEDPIDGTWKTTVTVLGKGTFAVQSDGQVLFTPEVDYEGIVDPVLYRVTDANGTTRTAAIDVVIGNAPVAAPDSGTTLQGHPVTVPLLANDHPGTGGTLTPGSTLLLDPADTTYKASVTIADEGTWTVDPATGSVTFTPLPAYVGHTTPVAYEVTDSYGNTATSTARVTVAEVVPTASGDTATTPFRTPVTVTVLANDSAGRADTPLDPTTVQIKDPATDTWGTSVTVADVGTWTVKTDGSVAFTPVSTFDGVTAPLAYQVADSNGTYAESTLVVTVNAPYGAVSDPDSGSGSGIDPVTLSPLANDTPSNGATWIPSSVCLVPDSAKTIAGTALGDCPKSAVVAGVGTWVVNPDGTMTFTPSAGFTGTASIGYLVTDTNGVQVANTAQVTVTKLPNTGGPGPAVGIVGVLLLLAGGMLLLVARRRREHQA